MIAALVAGVPALSVLLGNVAPGFPGMLLGVSTQRTREVPDRVGDLLKVPGTTADYLNVFVVEEINETTPY